MNSEIIDREKIVVANVLMDAETIIAMSVIGATITIAIVPTVTDANTIRITVIRIRTTIALPIAAAAIGAGDGSDYFKDGLGLLATVMCGSMTIRIGGTAVIIGKVSLD
ncbi:MAG: hypothetical protein Q7S32_02900 [bacterium]|nr:hypothetical protein [bacterium]